jgi:hypothetical protein
VLDRTFSYSDKSYEYENEYEDEYEDDLNTEIPRQTMHHPPLSNPPSLLLQSVLQRGKCLFSRNQP